MSTATPLPTPLTSVVELGLADQRDWWALEGGSIRDTLAVYYDGDIPGELLPPPRDPTDLRERLRRAAPQLARLTDRIRRAFDEQASCAVLLPSLGLAGEKVDSQRKAVFCLAALLGDLTANIPFQRVVWDVFNRGEASTRHSSFSENEREADYHTDSGFLHVPERFFLLYAVRAADCGGGLSLVRDGRVLIDELTRCPGGVEAVRVLTETKLPRRIPKAFRKDGYVAEDGYQYTPVLADLPLWRWRKDKLYKGIIKFPKYATPEVRRALDAVSSLLENGKDELRQQISTDGLLVVNNHISLHARTAFTDPRRRLLRLRFHQPAASR